MKALSTSVRMLAAHLCFTAPCTLALMLGIPAVKDCIQVRGEASAVPFIGQIRDVEARSSGKRREVHVLVAWFYRPEEAQGGRKARPAFAVLPARLQPGGMGGARRAPRRSAGRPAPVRMPLTQRARRQAFHGEKELFKSEHLDWCMATTIEGRCQVHSLRAYQVRAARSSAAARAGARADKRTHPLRTRAQALKKVEPTDYFTRFTYKVRALLGLLGLLGLLELLELRLSVGWTRAPPRGRSGHAC